MSLVEAMFGAFILAVGILGMASVMTQAEHLSRHSDQTRTAFLAAQERLEDLREYARLNFDRLEENFDGVGFGVDGLSPALGDADGLHGLIEIDEAVPLDPDSRLLDVTITVAFAGVAGNREISMETRLAPR